MYSVFEMGGKQYNVKKGDIIAVDKMDGKKEKDKIVFENVLLINDGKENVTVGSPYIANAKVEAEVVDQVRDSKVLVFKFKRRKNYKRLKGHKQSYTRVKINKIVSA